MLNGILLVSSSSGALLFSKAYAPNFGFPPGDEGHMDVMSLAAMVHALQLNARALDHADDCSGLKMIETDDLQMQFHQEGSILCAVFSPRKLDAAVGRDLSELIAQRFAGVYGHLVVPGKPIAAKQFKKFRSELRAILGQLPGRIMERAFESLGAPGLAGLPYVCALTCDYAPTYSDESTEANLVHALRPGGDQPANASLQRASSSAVTGPPKVLFTSSAHTPSAEGAINQLVRLLDQCGCMIGALGSLGDSLQSLELHLAQGPHTEGSDTRVLLLCKQRLCVAVAAPTGEVEGVEALLGGAVLEQLCEYAAFEHTQPG
eukprot:TRINITY_DN2539_c0_g1_i1.p1 TRINITY_DN2539_c0_g1~~TRINITY_DN2539_c0_g1_i1.p1  ORF type:complete len:319 (-),score=76.79 TRINITY_DN2539_c0_g1_i1:180-1136(-)